MVSGDLSVLLAVAGLILLTLMAASVVKMYQQQQALRRQRLSILQAGIEKIEQLLEDTQELGLSRELRMLLQRERVARMQAMQRMFPRLPNINERLQEARRAVEREGPPSSVQLRIEDEQMLSSCLGALIRLGRLISENALVTRLNTPDRKTFALEVEEAAVRCNFNYHKYMAKHFQQGGLLSKARGHVQVLLSYLKQVSLETEKIQAMRAESQELSRRMFELSLSEMRGNNPAEATAPGSQASAADQV